MSLSIKEYKITGVISIINLWKLIIIYNILLFCALLYSAPILPSLWPLSVFRIQSMYQSRHCLVEAADPGALGIGSPACLSRAV